MAAIRGYIATSLDGYIAERDGSVDWLRPYEDLDLGYPGFIAEIGVTVMGRHTFDQIMALGGDWPYPGQQTLVVTSRALKHAAPNVAVWHDGVAALAGHLRAMRDGDIWVVGGSMLQSAMLDLGALDRLEIFVMPVLLGRGIPLFRRLVHKRQGVLQSARAMAGGVARLDYRFRSADTFF